MTASPIVIAGTGTGVGKTTLTALLTVHLRRLGVGAVAMKPYCSGGREDTQLLTAVNDGELTERQVTPVHCSAPLAPLAGMTPGQARNRYARVIRKIEQRIAQAEVLLIEGIGGLEVPLAPGAAVSDLIARLGCRVLLVGQNRLGVINEVSLAQLRLQTLTDSSVPVVLMQPRRLDLSAATNPDLIAGRFPEAALFQLPFLGFGLRRPERLRRVESKVADRLAEILKACETGPKTGA